MYRTILVANDGSSGAGRALLAALDLAKRDRAELHQICVEEHLPHYAAIMGEVIEAKQEAKEFFRRVIAEADAAAEAHDVRLTSHVIPGHAVETIATYAKDHGFDLLVIGFTGHSNIYGRIWGGTSQNLVRLAPCSVLVVK
jgi:nucleotide-binding universal stress UspA family protein